MAASGRDIGVAGGTGHAVRLKAGDTISVVNIHGTQVVDTWAFPLDAMPSPSRAGQLVRGLWGRTFPESLPAGRRQDPSDLPP